MNPALLKVLLNLAPMLADDESRKKLLYLIIGIPVGFIIFLALVFQYITTSPLSAVTKAFSGVEMDYVYDIRDDNGFDDEQNFGDDFYTGELIRNGVFAFPIAEDFHITNKFGPRIHPVFFTKQYHAGVDIGVGTGTPVHPFMDGIVTYAAVKGHIYQGGGYGNLVIIDHGNGLTSRYAHLSRFNCKKGDKVKVDNIIAFVGSTGTSTGPHLHFEVRTNNKPTDPMKYFEEDESDTETPSGSNATTVPNATPNNKVKAQPVKNKLTTGK